VVLTAIDPIRKRNRGFWVREKLDLSQRWEIAGHRVDLQAQELDALFLLQPVDTIEPPLVFQ